MNKININLGDRSYPIYISTDYNGISKCIESARVGRKLVIVTDTNVDSYQSSAFLNALDECGCEVYKYVINAGEKSKNLDTVRCIYEFLAGLKLDRNSTLIALGGGVVGDITGFAAATFLRGINFVQVPTTLLAQADSSVGGKVGVDFEGSKNIIGAFYQPKFVYINVNSLRTLPQRELRSGLAEVVKHGLIMDADFFDYIDSNADKISNLDEGILQYMAKMNCSIKGSVVEQDEKENGLRAILNFGHTIGHAVESISNFELLHGECVSIGMAGAFRMARYLQLIDEETVIKVENTLKNIGLPVKADGLDVSKVYNQMFHDKKIKGNKLTFILPRRIGEVIQLRVDDEALIRKVLNELV